MDHRPKSKNYNSKTYGKSIKEILYHLKVCRDFSLNKNVLTLKEKKIQKYIWWRTYPEYVKNS